MFKIRKIRSLIIPKGMSIRLTNFSILNGFWYLDEQMSNKCKTVADQVVTCDDKFFIGAVNSEELKGDCEATIDIYDCSAAPEMLIGKLIYLVSIKQGVIYDWVPVSADYVIQLADLYHPPATLRLIKIPKQVQNIN